MLSERHLHQLKAGLDVCLVERGISQACSYLGADLRLFKIRYEDKVFEAINWDSKQETMEDFDQNIIDQAYNKSIHLMSDYGVPISEIPF